MLLDLEIQGKTKIPPSPFRPRGILVGREGLEPSFAFASDILSVVRIPFRHRPTLTEYKLAEIQTSFNTHGQAWGVSSALYSQRGRA